MKLFLTFFVILLLIPVCYAQFNDITIIKSGNGFYEKEFSYEFNNMYFINKFSQPQDSYISFDYYNRPAKILSFSHYEATIYPMNHPWNWR